jgi:hypothetical protein
MGCVALTRVYMDASSIADRSTKEKKKVGKRRVSTFFFSLERPEQAIAE